MTSSLSELGKMVLIMMLDAQMNAFCRFAVQELNNKMLAIATKHNVTMIDIFSRFTDYGM